MGNKGTLNYLLIGGIALAVLAGVVGGTQLLRKSPVTPSEQQQGQDKGQQAVGFEPVSDHTLVYGQWTGDGSVIRAFNLQTGKKHLIAKLPLAVKKVTVLTPETLLYIGETNERDHGKQLVKYSIQEKKAEVVYEVSDDFGIDDYVVSPNGQYVAVWEVKFAPSSGVLLGGASRVRTVDLTNPANTHVVYDEVQQGEMPVAYPRAVTNTGEVYVDRFLPNSGAGWAYGMSVSSFDGTKKEDLPSMRNGTYGTQPVVSPDGRLLAFAGYEDAENEDTDGKDADGDGNDEDKDEDEDGKDEDGDGKDEDNAGTLSSNGFRNAVLSPNTLEVFDTLTKTRQKLENIVKDALISNVSWDPTNGKILFTAVPSDPAKIGMYSYNLAQRQAIQLPKPVDGSDVTILAALNSGGVLAGTADQSPSSLGNLGDAYGSSFTNFLVKMDCKIVINGQEQDCSINIPQISGIPLPSRVLPSININITTPPSPSISGMPAVSGMPGQNRQIISCKIIINGEEKACPPDGNIQLLDTKPILQGGFMQLISILPASFFGESLAQQAAGPTGTGIECAGSNSSQLCTFYLKTALADKRAAQQGEPVNSPGYTSPDSSLPNLPSSPLSKDGKPRCRDLAAKQCKEKGMTEGTGEYDQCVRELKVQNRKADACFDSPLYLSGKEGQHVTVTINTPIYNTNVQPESGNTYHTVLQGNGTFAINGASYDSLTYDYTPAIKRFSPPTAGTVVAREEVGTVLTDYAARLGLNAQETTDLLTEAKMLLDAPYVFISFFDQEISEKLLPISFDPVPDTYRNIVFYFRQYSGKPAFTPKSPSFPAPINRSGFTAVEISSLVE